MAVLLTPRWQVGEYTITWWMDPNRHRVMIWHEPTNTLHKKMWSKDKSRLAERLEVWVAAMEANDE